MQYEPIGWVETCFEEKFAVPRQSGLCPSAWGKMHFHEAYRNADMVRGLEGFSHVWLIFSFHQTVGEGWSPTVRPPRLGGNERMGVLATRSTYRPNGLGLSLCRLEQVAAGPVLHLGGVDLVSGTPVLDVKPYLAYSDFAGDAVSGYATEPPQKLDVIVEKSAEKVFSALPLRTQNLLLEALSFDPRPAIHQDPERQYGVKLAGLEVGFCVGEKVFLRSLVAGKK